MATSETGSTQARCSSARPSGQVTRQRRNSAAFDPTSCGLDSTTATDPPLHGTGWRLSTGLVNPVVTRRLMVSSAGFSTPM